eukprot:Gb_15919 [translate_table: standard]
MKKDEDFLAEYDTLSR